MTPTIRALKEVGLVGAKVRKNFPGYGEFCGEVIEIQGDSCLLKWEDGSESKLKQSSVKRLVIKEEETCKKDETTEDTQKKKKVKKENEGSKKRSLSKVSTPALESYIPKKRLDFAGTSGQKKGLNAIEKFASAWLAENKDINVAPDIDHVLKTLRLLDKNWPTQQRPNVTTTGKEVTGMCLGLIMALGQGAQCSYLTDCFPETTRYLVRFCRNTLPRTKAGNLFPFSSLQINYNYAAAKHVDGNNIGPSYIMSIGSHTGGELWTEDQGTINCYNKWKLFDGNKLHYTQAFDLKKSSSSQIGERISFIAFAHGLYSKVEPAVVKQLRGLGFTAARSDGIDDDFFVRFRIDRSYLSEENNQKFIQLKQQRLAQQDPRATLTKVGDAAVECYGRQAERGGGWMAIKLSASEQPTVLQLKPNSVGIWIAELKWKNFTHTSLELVKHHRLDFYKDVKGATNKFKDRIKNLPDGAPVILGIADTAAASSRPLGPKVYEILKQLGAPLDLPEIKYRVAWAMIGFKGAKPGTALTTVGTRSTLLRLDANFSLESQPGGSFTTKLTPNAAPDVTNIIDVVAGTGQDCAVVDNDDDDDDQVTGIPQGKKARVK
mmetsp:Transcript_5628/g.7989  ORF Transcript_5628/g.7989 Transcript_5628/m.7989 type:complete len:604 (-) Transcript_5628:240-2051(-)